MSTTPPPGEPTPLNYAQPARNDLREIARRQRGLNICILAYIVLIILRFTLPPQVMILVLLAVAAVVITSAVFVFMLSIAVYNTGAGIVLGILTLIPIVGLIILLIINGKATSILRSHGIKVGLMGADPKQIPDRL
jgi:hypothetical protein